MKSALRQEMEADLISSEAERRRFHPSLLGFHRAKHDFIFFNSEVFRNFVDAFRAFSVCRQIRTGEMHFPTIWRFKLGNNFLIRQMISSFQTENML